MIKSDIERLTGQSFKYRRLFNLLLTDPGVQAIVLFRIQGFFVRRGLIRIAKLMRVLNLTLTGADFCVGCIIGEALIVRHSNGIVIGSGTVIGKNCTLLQQVTTGEKYGDGADANHAYPQIGDNVVLGAGAKIIGGVRIGNNVSIGTNSVVLIDVPSDSTIVGIPGKIVGHRSRP